jgi:hypothetical protein
MDDDSTRQSVLFSDLAGKPIIATPTLGAYSGDEGRSFRLMPGSDSG